MFSFNKGYAQIVDTVKVASDEIESPIAYSADDSLYADMKRNQIHLYGNAVVDDGDVRLEAGYILIDLKANEVLAMYRYDEDSIEVEHPVFTDGAEKINARKVRFNFNTEKAYIEEVAIQQDENYLYMAQAKRQSNEEVHFRKGRFTTCNQDDPHYHFQLSSAVLVPEKRIVSGPMNLWIKGVPTPVGLPFSVIPQVEDKTSGILFPEIVPISQYGFGFNELGYYIPVNDRFQTTFYASLYSRGSWGLGNQSDYAKIYKYRGNVNLLFQQFRSGFPENARANKLSVTWIHQSDRKSSPYWNFNSNVRFISDNNSKNNLDPLNGDYFTNSFNSDINLNRYFPGKPVTAGMKLSLRQNSQTQNISLASPVVNVNVSRFFPFKKLFTSNKGWRSIFTSLGVTYTFEGQNRTLFKDSLLQQGLYDRIGDEFQQGMNQRISIQTTGGLFKNALKLTPSVTYGNKANFQQIRKSYDATNNATVEDTIRIFGMAHDLNFSLQATTALYSYYKFVGKKQPLMRHVLTPSLRFSYIPNINELITDSVGVDMSPITYSPFERSLYASGNTNDQALISFGFNNTFELKRKSYKDTVSGFKKTRIIDLLSFTGSYDLRKDSMNLSNIGINLRVSPINWLNFVATSSFSPYDWVDSTGATVADYAIKTRKNLGRFVSTNLATTITLTSEEGRKELNEVIERIPENWNADYNYFMLYPEQLLNFNIPWRISLSHVYTITANQSKNSFNSDTYNQVQTLMLNGDVSFTKRWKLTSQVNFDLKEVDITNARISLNRDMHCWALAFHWTPIGGNKSFLFSIRSTSALFQDAKIELRRPPAFL